eukprot:GSChrysophyteH1.ASY1.ANO1.320.1 assembled CDS
MVGGTKRVHSEIESDPSHEDYRAPMTAEEKAEAARFEAIAKRAEERAMARAAAAAAEASKEAKDAPASKPSIGNKELAPPTVETPQAVTKPAFVSKAEREAAALARLNAKRQEKEKLAKDAEMAHKRFSQQHGSAQREREQEKNANRRRQEHQSSEKSRGYIEHTGKDEYEREMELRAIKLQYLGKSGAEEGAGFGSAERSRIFKMEWDNSEDTGRNDFNPLYSKRFGANPLFGRGVAGGTDVRREKLNTNFSVEDQRRLELASKAAMKQQHQAQLTSYDLSKDNLPGQHWSDKALSDMTERDWRIFREDFDIRIKGGKAVNPPLRSWREAALPTAISRAIKDLGYKDPSPIQRQAIPVGLARRDIIGIAETGSGKTSKMTSRDAMAENEAVKLMRHTNFLSLNGVHVVSGTPGRLCNYIVLDEADRMVDMGFEASLTSILDAMGLSDVRVTAMFSATMPPEVERIAKTYLRHPAVIKIGDEDSGKNRRINQQILWMHSEGQKKSKIAELLHKLQSDEKCIVFVNAKKQADVVGRDLDRNDTLEAFRRGDFRIMVATDVAGRGLDIPDVSYVFNYDCPAKIENYTHRIGRTGRAGRTGTAITLLTESDKDIFYDLKSYLESTECNVPDQLKNHPAATSASKQINEGSKHKHLHEVRRGPRNRR